jgi:hypothetical protein
MFKLSEGKFMRIFSRRDDDRGGAEMGKDLDVLLDNCIDRINEGELLEECLASYPEQARELEPLLRAMFDIRDTCSTMPTASAKSVTRHRSAAWGRGGWMGGN